MDKKVRKNKEGNTKGRKYKRKEIQKEGNTKGRKYRARRVGLTDYSFPSCVLAYYRRVNGYSPCFYN